MNSLPPTETCHMLQGQSGRWATIRRGTLEEMSDLKRDYEKQTGLGWRGFRIIKAVTTYHAAEEPENEVSK